MWFIAELFEGVFATGRWPIGIYPGWLKYSLTYLIPIGFAVTVPAEAVTSRLGWTTVVVALGFAAALFAFTRWFWTFGLRRYSGASA
jgi:ABC-2 type transport system permease protein